MGFDWLACIIFLGKSDLGNSKSLQAKDIGHGVEKGDRSGCFCHDVSLKLELPILLYFLRMYIQ